MIRREALVVLSKAGVHVLVPGARSGSARSGAQIEPLRTHSSPPNVSSDPWTGRLTGDFSGVGPLGPAPSAGSILVSQ